MREEEKDDDEEEVREEEKDEEEEEEEVQTVRNKRCECGQTAERARDLQPAVVQGGSTHNYQACLI